MQAAILERCVMKAKNGYSDKDWSLFDFEAAADVIDEEDEYQWRC